jgi:DNA processing protein
VDSAAHRGALDAGGATISVMGCGLDRPYPEENADLFDEIARTGAVVSEFPFGTPPESHHFPLRNRVIAGLSLGTIVVEGKETSGSMITADCALDAGRDVFAVPGPITSPLTAAPHKLLVQGARLVRGARDVIEELGLEAPADTRPLPLLDGRSVPGDGEGGNRPASVAGVKRSGLSAVQGRVLVELEIHRGRTADDLSATLAMPTGELLAVLMDLELVGLAKQLAGGRFVRRKLES